MPGLLAPPGRCPLCQAAAASWIADHRQLRIVGCSSCGHRYLDPIPSSAELAALYADPGYYQGSRDSIGFLDYASLRPARQRMFARHLLRLERAVQPGSVLDVGCATGDFLKVARDRGWQVFGVDPSAARGQAEAAGIPLLGSTIQDVDAASRRFQAVTFWDVLEHVPDPLGELRKARSLLAPGGVVALTVPDAGNIVARLSGRRWFGYKTAGEHLQFYTAGSLRQAIDAAGLRVVLMRPTTWSCSLGFLADRGRLYLGPFGRGLHRLLASRPLSPVVVDVPLINQFALARAAGETA